MTARKRAHIPGIRKVLCIHIYIYMRVYIYIYMLTSKHEISLIQLSNFCRDQSCDLYEIVARPKQRSIGGSDLSTCPKPSLTPLLTSTRGPADTFLDSNREFQKTRRFYLGSLH